MTNISKLPDYFYKYGSMQKPKYLKEALLENKIWFQSPLKLNDPFDCRPRVVAWGQKQGLIKALRARIKQRNPNIPRNELRTGVERAYKTLRKMDDLTEKLEVLFGQRGVYCLSERKENLLMWTHYADNHQGYCLEFSSRIKGPLSNKPSRIQYQREYPIIRFTQQSSGERGRAGFLTKASDWEYEKEWRLLAKTEGHFLFKSDALIGLILGCKTKDEDRRLIEEWISQRSTPLNLWKAEMHKEKFALEFVRLN